MHTTDDRRWTISAFGALAMWAALTCGPGTIPASQFRGDTELVRVFVTVTDRSGRLVKGLDRRDFEVRDNDERQPIAVFDPGPQSMRLVVMADVSGSVAGSARVVHEAVGRLLAALASTDRVRLGVFCSYVDIRPEAFSPPSPRLLAHVPDQFPVTGGTALWRAVDEALNAFAEPGEGRPVIVVISDGWNNDGRRPPVTASHVMERATAAEVAIYGVLVRPRTARSPWPDVRRDGIRNAPPDNEFGTLAERTGGRQVEGGFANLEHALGAIVAEVRGQYLIGFEPRKRDGEVHGLTVKVLRAGMKATSRPSYLAARP